VDARGTLSLIFDLISTEASEHIPPVAGSERVQLRILPFLAALAIAGCSSDGVHSPQKFFPGSKPTSWESCDKFGTAGDEIQICASTGLLAGHTAPTYNIRFSLPNSAPVRIAVFDEHAHIVKVLLDDLEDATLPGEFRQPPIVWDFTDEGGTRVPDGDYRVYFQSDTFLSTSDVVVQ
jgi:hypothetical protein